jgi:hypothetical protein
VLLLFFLQMLPLPLQSLATYLRASCTGLSSCFASLLP